MTKPALPASARRLTTGTCAGDPAGEQRSRRRTHHEDGLSLCPRWGLPCLRSWAWVLKLTLQQSPIGRFSSALQGQICPSRAKSAHRTAKLPIARARLRGRSPFGADRSGSQRDSRRSRAIRPPGAQRLCRVGATWELSISYPVQTPRATYFVSRYSPIPSKPPSRPKPDCLTPPKGAAGFETRPWFSPIIPASIASLTRNARERSRV